jgi:hypothetical protein
VLPGGAVLRYRGRVSSTFTSVAGLLTGSARTRTTQVSNCRRLVPPLGAALNPQLVEQPSGRAVRHGRGTEAAVAWYTQFLGVAPYF